MANNEVETAMMRFEYFHKWNKETIAECCSLAKIKKYNENVIILGEGIGFPNYVYFVLNGRCKIIEELYVCILNPLSCFGFGEAMDRRMVVTTEPTECLLIPHYWLTQQTLNNLWNKIGIFLRRHIPSTEYVFKEFVNQRKWLKHREELVEQILFTKKRTSNNQISNVPYFLRIGKNIDSY
ncbi:hypothetical protein RI129_007885 [Pyrocoelia pectoralis]|uniref:Cyclic nucleotide-binding domain-containing protein n=1 Tax=Pyrocoelia pectoralis TaxID=417401 RepID=A0AAN7V960_9COLE